MRTSTTVDVVPFRFNFRGVGCQGAQERGGPNRRFLVSTSLGNWRRFRRIPTKFVSPKIVNVVPFRFNFRGEGDSGGSPTFSGEGEKRDVASTCDFLLQGAQVSQTGLHMYLYNPHKYFTRFSRCKMMRPATILVQIKTTVVPGREG